MLKVNLKEEMFIFFMKKMKAVAAFSGATILFFSIFPLAGCGVTDGIQETLSPTKEEKLTIPTATISADKTSPKVGGQVTLDGSGSSDPQGEQLTLAWNILEKPVGSSAALGSSTDIITTFVVDEGGYYTISLQVTNVSGDKSDIVTVKIGAVGTGDNHPPVASAGADATATAGSVAVLDGSGSYDQDENSITYRWSVLSAPATSTVTSVSSSTSIRAFLFPDVAGKYVIHLVVSDGTDADEAFVTITAS